MRPYLNLFIPNIFLSVFILVVSTSCSKDTNTGSDNPKDTIPVVYSISPQTGTMGDTITISGKNFSTVIGENRVSFEGANAEIISASSTILTVKVPVGSNEVNVWVFVHELQAVNKPVFTFLASLKPELSSINPSAGGEGTSVYIFGSSFSDVISENVVNFGSLQAQVTSVYSYYIKVIVPAITANTTISLIVNGKEAENHPDFYYNLMSCEDASNLEVSDITITGVDEANESISFSFELTNNGINPLILDNFILNTRVSADNIFDSNDEPSGGSILTQVSHIFNGNETMLINYRSYKINNYLVLIFDCRDYLGVPCETKNEDWYYVLEVPKSK